MRLYLVEEHRVKRGVARWRPINKIFWSYKEAKAFAQVEDAWALPGKKYKVTHWQKVERCAKRR